MPRVMTVRQFPPSESFSNRVIFESPQMLSFHLFPTCFLLLRFLCFLCFFCLALCHSDLIFWSLVSHSRFLLPNELATNIVRVPLKSRKIQANFLHACQVRGSIGDKSNCRTQSSNAIPQGQQRTVNVGSLNHAHACKYKYIMSEIELS